MLCIKVPKTEGEKVRKKLLEEDLLAKGYKIAEEKGYLLIPIKEGTESFGYEMVERELQQRKEKERRYEDIADVPDELRDQLPSSYEIIGDIAVLKIPDDLDRYGSEIGEAILKTHKNVNTVMSDQGVKGERRIRDLQLIAGEDRTETIHREHGVEFELDIGKVYFSPRLATERWRVVKKVNEGETVFDMFAGVGPFSILIAKEVNVERIHSVDINPAAVEFLKRNVERNNLEGKIEVYMGDAAEVAEEIEADRVIMNLPHSSYEYIESALDSLTSGTIHYYELVRYDELDGREEELIDMIYEVGRKVTHIDSREVRTYSAARVHMAYDIEID